MQGMRRLSRDIRNQGSIWTKMKTGVRVNPQTVIIAIVKNRQFELLVSLLIIGNAIVIGVQVDWSMSHLYEERPTVHWVLDLLFTLFFAVELSMRAISEGVNFFQRHNKHFLWNCFDAILVLLSIIEEIVALVSAGKLGGVSAIRLLRILRLIRVIRVVRVMRFFRDLRVLVHGIASSLKSLVWCAALLLVYMYIFSILLMQAVIEEYISHRHDPEGGFVGPYGDHADQINYNFNSCWRSVYTLYQAISGGVDWGEVVEPLNAISPLLTILFSLYIAFAIFCVLNIVTGVFVENAHKIVNDEEHMIMEDLASRRQWFEEVLQVFKAADKDESGELSFEEFQKHVADLRVQAYFRKVGINIESDSSQSLFQLLDFDQNGKVNVDEFVLGCTKFGGTARGVDIARLRHDNGQLRKDMRQIEKKFLGNLEAFEVKMIQLFARVFPALSMARTDSPKSNATAPNEKQVSHEADWLPHCVKEKKCMDR
jgi:hypothetical protein